MMARESVKARMASEHGISFTEFTYMLLQAHDYLWLHENMEVELQIGGSYQWGNIVSGVDLIRRVRGEAAHGLCWPLLLADDGTKLGKTTGARVWLDPELTSPYAFYQHFVNTDDASLRRNLAQFTLLPVAEVDDICAAHESEPGRREGQKRLAQEITTLVHGLEHTATAVEATRILFGGDPRDASAEALSVVAAEVPSTTLAAADDLASGVDLAGVLVSVGLASSLGDARRALDQRGISVNGVKAEPGATLSGGDLLHGRWVLLRKGKKGWAVLDGGPARVV